jgi:lambda repressor-like predicted transcriptional regulator
VVRSWCVARYPILVAVNRAPRRLVHDAELVRRRAAGESLRSLAADYGVVHTTLSRCFARKDVAAQLRAARRALGAEGRAAKARRVAERQLERTVRRQAKEEVALARSFSEGGVQPRRARRSDFEAAWLDDRDARRPLLPQDLRSRSDELAAGAAESGGGIDALIEATGLRTLENLVRNIDPAILVRAYDNDAAARAFAPPDGSRLRRLSPDLELLHRRAAGEPLRRLARDYGVTHTTLGRWFARPSVAREINKLQRRRRPCVQPQTGHRHARHGGARAGTRV